MSTAGPPSPPPPFGPPPSYDPPPSFGGPPPRPPRPATVTAAALLVFAEALVTLAGIGFAFATRDIAVEVTRNAPNAAESPIKPELVANFSLLLSSVCAGVVIVLLLVLGALLLRGNNVSRIVTWVVAGLYLLCIGISGLSSVITTDQHWPDWYKTYSAVSGVFQLAIWVGIIALLAMRPSNEFFGRPPHNVQQY